ncbi:hypothetical protein IAG15_15995 [Enterococcus faecalis]|nr:hypothetical protein [Enterococcus faecalis]
MKVYLQDIRTQSELANIIIVGSHIDYEDLLKNHYRVFGVIDRTDNQSISFLMKEIRYYLDGIYGDSLGRG